MAPHEKFELTGWANVCAVDAGGGVGWSVFCVHPEALIDDGVPILGNIQYWSAGVLAGPEYRVTVGAVNFCAQWPDGAVVGESFDVRKKIRSAEYLSPVRINAVLDYENRRRWGREMFMQSASDAKKTCPDERLKAWNLYTVGPDHARDATRHAVLFLRRAKANKLLRERAWPKLFANGGVVYEQD